MKKFIPIVAVVFAMAALITPAWSAYFEVTFVQLKEQNNSTQFGTAELRATSNGTWVTIYLTSGGSYGMPGTGYPGTSTDPEPAHFHMGQCGSSLNPDVLHSLNGVVEGSSSTMLNVSYTHLRDELLAGHIAINIHKSQTEAKTYVACGDETSGVFVQQGVGMPVTGVPGAMGNEGFLLSILAVLAVIALGASLRLVRPKYK